MVVDDFQIVLSAICKTRTCSFEEVLRIVISEEDLEDTISAEIEIAFMAGIPYARRYMNGKLYLQPTKGLNMEELEIGAPQDVINFLNQYSY